MIRSNKFFLIVIVIGVVVIAGLAIAIYADKFEAKPSSPLVNGGGVEEPATVMPEPTANIDSLVDSFEKELYEEAAVIYEEDQDIDVVAGDSTEINGLIGSVEDSAL